MQDNKYPRISQYYLKTNQNQTARFIESTKGMYQIITDIAFSAIIRQQKKVLIYLAHVQNGNLATFDCSRGVIKDGRFIVNSEEANSTLDFAAFEKDDGYYICCPHLTVDCQVHQS